MTENTVPVSELKASFEECLRKVKEGERWKITEQGRVVAILGPPPSFCDDLAELAASDAVRLGSRRLPAKLWDLPQPEDPDDSTRRAVLEERERKDGELCRTSAESCPI